MPKPKSTPRGVVSRPDRVAIAILAAGKGTRLKSRYPKVLHEIAGKPLLAHVVAAAAQVVESRDIFAIIGHQAKPVRQALAPTGISFVLQSEQRGTGHAIMMARDALSSFDTVLVLSGDVPLIQPQTIARLRDFHFENGAAMTILTAELDNPTGYGRVLRKLKKGRETDEVERIVEQKALRGKGAKHREINSGIYAFATKPLYAHIRRLTTDNAHQEFYLTDMAEHLRKAGEKVVALRAPDPSEVLGVNTRLELAKLDATLRDRKARELMEAGITIFRPETCDIDADVQIGADTVIEPFVQLVGNTNIGADCRIRSYSIITNCELGDGVLVRPGCILEDSIVRNGARLGPYSHLRPGSDIGEGAHVGNFVETKKTRLGKGSKANHLTYLGDSEIGEGVNVGAGTITCNYDGTNKYRTLIDDGAFIGSDATLVAPVRIGRGAYVGAGSCITEDVSADALAIGRGRQVTKEGWAAERRARVKKTPAT
jgi:bifunctional UDP-N-acetylglucosamine pyrophosphorylase / glucosamine-1-phosphate N-acetyltransferase